MPIDWQRNQRLFRRLSRMLGKVSRQPQPDAVHHFRTTARRLEAVFDALAPTPDRAQRKLLKQVGRVRRRCGKLRDVDVQLAALRTLKLGADQRKQRLRRHLEDLRGKRQKKLLAALDDGSVRKLRKRLRKVTTQMAVPTGGNATAAAAEPLPEGLRLFAAMVRGHGPLNEQTLHQYRIQGKRVRYLAEMAGEDPTAKQAVKDLKRMQDAIGEWHDYWDLTHTAEELFADSPNCPLVLALRNVTRAKFDEAVRVSADVKRVFLAVHRGLLAEARRAQQAELRRKPAPAEATSPAAASA